MPSVVSAPRCDPAVYDSLEKRLGLLTSLFNGGTGYVLMFLLELAKVDVQAAAAITTVVTNVIGLALDIVFAKKCFIGLGVDEYRLLPLTKRIFWFFRFLVSFSFVRFVMSVAIDILVTNFALRYVRMVLDENNILIKWRWRDTFIAIIISVVNFNLFVNRLRFDWAYEPETNAAIDFTVVSWLSSLVVAHITFEQIRP
jgi:hypothetical protein